MHSVRVRTSHSAALSSIIGVPKIFILDLDVAVISMALVRGKRLDNVV